MLSLRPLSLRLAELPVMTSTDGEDPHGQCAAWLELHRQGYTVRGGFQSDGEANDCA